MVPMYTGTAVVERLSKVDQKYLACAKKHACAGIYLNNANSIIKTHTWVTMCAGCKATSNKPY